MSRPTVAALAEQVAALTAEVAALKAQLEQQRPEWKPPPRPDDYTWPLDFDAMADKLGKAHAAYNEAGDVWGPGVYL